MNLSIWQFSSIIRVRVSLNWPKIFEISLSLSYMVSLTKRIYFISTKKRSNVKEHKNVPTQDFEDAVVTVALYVEGLRVGSVAILSQPFHKDVTMYGFTDGELLGGPIKNLYDFV